ncbi:MAG TPA: lactate racemase domain-containing protein [Chloroflexota bacterium]
MSSTSFPNGLWRDAVQGFSAETAIPRFHRVRLDFSRQKIGDLPAAVAAAMDSQEGAARLGGGKKVAITAGSRGINRIGEVIAAVVEQVRRYGGEPFVVPAMGSHGRATAEGQVELLAELGVTEKSVGAPIKATMEVVELGRLPNGMPVYQDRIANSADAIVVVNRVKPHTDFVGDIESGLSKMCVIGLGKRTLADAVHRYGTHGLRDVMPEAARFVCAHSPVAMGLALIESAYDDLAEVVALAPGEISGPKEAELLRRARDMMARIPFGEIDALVIDEMGKNVSGSGMDSNIVGRMRVWNVPDRPKPSIRTIAVLDLTKESHGNATGLGLADVTTRRLVEQVDFDAMYLNGITSGIGGIQRCFVPMVAPNDRAAIITALRCCGRPDTGNARVVRIKNTLKVGEMDISESLLTDVSDGIKLTQMAGPFDLRFNDENNILPFEESV